jgi:hypothetical protein
MASYNTQIATAYKEALEACNDLCGDSASVNNDIRRIPNLFGLGNIRGARFTSNLYWNFHANFFSTGVQSSLSEPVPSDDSKKNENE